MDKQLLVRLLNAQYNDLPIGVNNVIYCAVYCAIFN